MITLIEMMISDMMICCNDGEGWKYWTSFFSSSRGGRQASLGGAGKLNPVQCKSILTLRSPKGGRDPLQIIMAQDLHAAQHLTRSVFSPLCGKRRPTIIASSGKRMAEGRGPAQWKTTHILPTWKDTNSVNPPVPFQVFILGKIW